MSKVERRTSRSEYTGCALTLQLQACKDRSGVDAMILADQNGLVVASSHWNESAADQIAAKLTEVEPHQFRVASLRDNSMPRTISARGFHAGDQRLVVCAVGCPTEQTLGELYTAMGGVKRILAS